MLAYLRNFKAITKHDLDRNRSGNKNRVIRFLFYPQILYRIYVNFFVLCEPKRVYDYVVQKPTDGLPLL